MGRAGEEDDTDNIFAQSRLLAYSGVEKRKKEKKKQPTRARHSSAAIRESVAGDAWGVSCDKQARVYTNVCLCRTCWVEHLEQG